MIAVALLATCARGNAQDPRPCEPAPLVQRDGAQVTTAEQWFSSRRPEVLELFRRDVYGRAPAATSVTVERLRTKAALDGNAVRKQWCVRYADSAAATIHVLAYLPAEQTGPTPVFIALNFHGNQTIHPDPGIRMASCWVRNNDRLGINEHRATEATRGSAARRWPLAQILARGYGLVTACYGDIDPDFDDGFRNGAHGALRGDDGERAADAWGAISAWAWGLSRILDSLTLDDDIDQRRAAVLGHSRLGKTALWAGAQDPRFWMVISNDSGCGGAAYSRRKQGETVAAITKAFPHWFCQRFHGFAGKEDQLPVDQHLLLALCAPRPVYVASAEKDQWADPQGEFASTLGADAVYRLVCGDGLPVKRMPDLDQSARGRIGYHIRAGKHDLLLADWEHYLDFADQHLGVAPR